MSRTVPISLAPVPVKHWSFAGLVLTYWCNARCASCYWCSSPQGGLDMSAEKGLTIWEGLQSACPRGCRIHITGGEPFGRWETLLDLARRARSAGLGPLEAVETNGFWAADEGTVRDRLLALDEAGMGRLTVSCDPYHQQFVPIARVRYLVRLAEEVLGPGRVRVRWRDWAERGFDTDGLSPDRRRAVFGEFAGRGRDRLTGRAAEELAGDLPLTPARAFADNPCKENLLRCRHVHADGAGNIHLGTCAGIVVGKVARPEDARAAWRALSEGYAAMDLVGPLAREGPAAVMELARQRGFQESPRGYASKCHLCWSVRRWLFENGCFPDALCPANVYRP